MNLQRLCDALLASRGFAHKRDISPVMRQLSPVLPAGIRVGDDCAAIPDGDGHLLFAIEGFVEDFVEKMPWFAGYCGVMVNVSDIYAMGGRPLAVVDAVWSAGSQAGAPVLEGLSEASRRYGVPIVGGHTNARTERSQLAVAIVGRAKRLLTSFDARPGDKLLMAIDLRGEWQHPYPYWNASTSAPAERLRADLELFPALAESGLCDAAKDISMAGAIGTALMLLECSKAGASIDIDAIPRPDGIDLDDEAALLRWLTAFPSYGFVLSVGGPHVDGVLGRFRERGIACAVVGQVHALPQVTLCHAGQTATLWDVAAQAFITAGDESRQG
ncbi:MAG TPA: sll0787 family AIR synthase-like protein [Albitalea sp.]|uniref:sll0787 family AIR synthase-like protein n=1 Tax=Piscinibacter sp. TaxID=1903157 RepID=UPI002ED0F4FF